LYLAGWRYPGTAVVVGERRCEMPVREADLRPWMDRVPAYTILEAEIDGDANSNPTRLARIINIDASDADLEKLAARLQEPIVLIDPTLGRLEYSRRFGTYEGRAGWCGKDVEVRLECAHPEDPAAVLGAATQLFAEQAEWNSRVREFAVAKLLATANEWREMENEDEEELSADTFLSRMILDTICVEESGGFSFWHDDGDLFWGHSIQVRGSMAEGLTSTDIAG
jgi:hypothetical protein